MYYGQQLQQHTACAMFKYCNMAEDFAGVICKDDSLAGSLKKDRGPGRKSALTHWRPDRFACSVQLGKE